MTWLLISGSRDATPEMLDYTRRAVRRAYVLGWSIIVGDAKGVDAAAMAEAMKLGVPLSVLGITPRSRVYCTPPLGYSRIFGDSRERDEVMAHRADRGLFVWNGYSRGTKYTHDYMKGLGKEVHLVVFKAKEKK